MEQHPSWNDVNHSNLKKFIRKLDIVIDRHAEKEDYAHDLGISDTGSTEDILRSKVHQLEDELKQTKKDKEIALMENKKKIDELNMAVLSIKAKLKEIIPYKKERNSQKRLKNSKYSRFYISRT